MDKKVLFLYLAVGFGLLFLLPAAETVGMQEVGTFLVVGYWGMIILCLMLLALKSIFADYGIGNTLYNIWLCISLMCVAVGILAIIDDGVDKARWAVFLVLYGSLVGFLNRKEL